MHPAIWTLLTKVGDEVLRKVMTEAIPSTANQWGEWVARVKDHAKQPLAHPEFGAGELRLTEWRNGCWSTKWYAASGDRQVKFVDDATQQSAQQVYDRICAAIQEAAGSTSV
jgi:hypothetical protein